MADRDAKQPVESATTEVLREIDGLIKATEGAASEWGIRPGHPEWRFVSALLDAVRWFGRLAAAGTADLKTTMEMAERKAEAELAQLRAATQAADLAVRQAKLAQTSLEVQRETLVARMVETIAPQLAKGVKEWVVIRERRYNRNVEWARAAAVGSVVLSLIAGGYAWRAIQDSSATEALDRCLAHPYADPASGKRFCELDSLLPQPQ